MKTRTFLFCIFQIHLIFAADPLGKSIPDAEDAISPAIFIRQESESVRSYWKDDYVLFLASENGIIDTYIVYFPKQTFGKYVFTDHKALSLLRTISGHSDWTPVESSEGAPGDMFGYKTKDDVIATIHGNKLWVATESSFMR